MDRGGLELEQWVGQPDRIEIGSDQIDDLQWSAVPKEHSSGFACACGAEISEVLLSEEGLNKHTEENGDAGNQLILGYDALEFFCVLGELIFSHVGGLE